MKKSKWQRDAPMFKYSVNMTARHARHLGKKGAGSVSEGVRILAEEDAEGFVERRKGPADRRKK